MFKTEEIVFVRPIPWNYIPPAQISWIESVTWTKELVVVVQSTLSADKHIEHRLLLASQRLYLLLQLRKQGLALSQLTNVFDTIILFKIVNAAPAWSEYATLNGKMAAQKV